MATNEEIIAEVIKSRELNHSEHELILKAAKVSMELSEDINEVKQNWIGFKKTLIFARNIVFVLGIMWVLFRDPFNTTFGG